MSSEETVAIDGSKLREILELAGAPSEPTEATRQRVEELEDWLGKPLPAESRQFLLTPVELYHPDAHHPYIVDEFYRGLPDVDAFIDSCRDGDGYQGYFNATCHFLGLYPVGAQLQYGDFMYAMLVLEPHTDDRLGGVMYYDEREVGRWGASVSEFLLSAFRDFWEACDARVDGPDQDDVEIDFHYLRDCFVFEDYDWRQRPPAAQDLPEAIESAWDGHWRDRLELRKRWWVVAMLNDQFRPHLLSSLPTPQEWEAERERVTRTHHDAMYWLFAHMLLDNREELGECIRLSRENPSKLVAAVADHFETNPDIGERWSDVRETLFRMTREARAAG